jgi:hypothetical protein
MWRVPVPSRDRTGRVRAAFLVALAVGLLVAPTAHASAVGPTYPPVPLALDRWFVSNLSGAEVSPGTTGSIAFTVGDPFRGTAISSVVLTLAVYAFNAFPGNATSSVAVATAPVLVNATASGLEVNESLGSIGAQVVVPGSVAVTSSSTTPSGTFAVRTALRFVANGTAFLLESRGWFTAAQWAAATEGPNGSVDLNVSALGVSGVLPETSVLVSSSDLATALWAILAAGLVLVGLAAWFYFRPPKSRSGVGKAADDRQAPSAFGSSRTRDGD